VILADTSVWVDHLRKGHRRLADLLQEGAVLCHPFVIGELACGRMKNRDEILDLLATLPSAPTATHEEVMRFVADRRLAGKGIGWIDAHLLCSALLGRASLWTRDKALDAAARKLGIGG
jgi:predicted nucleic acid-binding protein